MEITENPEVSEKSEVPEKLEMSEVLEMPENSAAIQMEKENKSRLINVMKGLLMIFVVIGHNIFLDYNSGIVTLIYSFHMPAFLIIGGYLSHINENNTFKGIITKRFRNHIAPYYYFYFISLVLLYNANLDKGAVLVNIFEGVGMPSVSLNLPLWFLPFYFSVMTVFELLSLVVLKIFKMIFKMRNIGQGKAGAEVALFSTCLFLCLICYKVLIHFSHFRFMNLDVALVSLCFVYFGHLIRISEAGLIRGIRKISRTRGRRIAIGMTGCILFVAGFALWFFLSLKNGRVDLNARNYQTLPLTYFNACLFFILFIFICAFLSQGRVLRLVGDVLAFMGKVSIYILVYHVPVSVIIMGLINSYMPECLIIYLGSFNLFSAVYYTSLQIILSIFMYAVHQSLDEARKRKLSPMEK